MTNEHRVAELLKAGDALAGMLGCATVAMEDGEPFTPIEVSIVRTELLRWQRIKMLVAAE